MIRLQHQILGAFSAGIVFLCAMIFGGSIAVSAELGGNIELPIFYQYRVQGDQQAAIATRYVRQAMFEKAIADAQAAGVTFVRSRVTGFFPAKFNDSLNDLAGWQNDPQAFWSGMDAIFDTLDNAGIQLVPSIVWNPAQFPATMQETLTEFLQNPQSESRKLLTRYISEFIGRYKSRRTILFYELTNELNLDADVNLINKCQSVDSGPCVWSNFTTADMLQFSQELVTQIKVLDSSRGVTSGYSLPRLAATHLMNKPEFAPGGPDWTLDTRDEFMKFLLMIHEPFDIISVHIYPGGEDVRFGRPPDQGYLIADDAVEVARTAGKKLYIGEFGDSGPTPYIARLLDRIVADRVDYSSIWVWEFYQTTTYQTRNTNASRYSIEPSYSADLIKLLMQSERAQGHPAPPTGKGGTPRVVLTWPLPCAVVNQPIDLYAVASDGVNSVDRVEFAIDGTVIGTVSTPPYMVHFDPVSSGDRLAQITARAVAKSGEKSEFASTVQLNNSGAACQVPL
jgi:hypothetical protein